MQKKKVRGKLRVEATLPARKLLEASTGVRGVLRSEFVYRTSELRCPCFNLNRF
jgi:hypothetical protein